MKSAPRMQPDNLLKQVISNDPDICSNDSFAFVNHVSKSLIEKVQQLMSTPQFIPVGRIVRVTNGNANYKVNMLPVDLMSGDVLIIPENSYLEINSFSTDFDVQCSSFRSRIFLLLIHDPPECASTTTISSVSASISDSSGR